MAVEDRRLHYPPPPAQAELAEPPTPVGVAATAIAT